MLKPFKRAFTRRLNSFTEVTPLLDHVLLKQKSYFLVTTSSKNNLAIGIPLDLMLTQICWVAKVSSLIKS